MVCCVKYRNVELICCQNSPWYLSEQKKKSWNILPYLLNHLIYYWKHYQIGKLGDISWPGKNDQNPVVWSIASSRHRSPLMNNDKNISCRSSFRASANMLTRAWQGYFHSTTKRGDSPSQNSGTSSSISDLQNSNGVWYIWKTYRRNTSVADLGVTDDASGQVKVKMFDDLAYLVSGADLGFLLGRDRRLRDGTFFRLLGRH